ncbi:hypothetical protein [Fulvivirga ligni]|uniref:hypothetical protein n=1 Tax=Fulvivirga ligni TaxID=2904246 RepID=UPI001F29FCDB|nr:hypothetical protein [Fulvivirga ligni]UII19921.1 hypothetical protein LVD16_18935 [Fulvivirga ligni]
MTKKELKNKANEQVNKHGLVYNGKIYLWRFIDGLYLRLDDHDDDSVKEDLLIVMRSGKVFSHSMYHINYLSKRRLKRIINYYRHLNRIENPPQEITLHH